MRNFIDTAKRGAETLGAEIDIAPKQDPNKHSSVIDRLKKINATKIPVETSDGVKKDIEVVGFPVKLKSLPMLQMLSAMQTAGYLRTPENGITQHGMLSPNFDHTGKNRKSSVRFQPVNDGFTIKNGVWVPEAKNAGLEAEGIGSEGSHGKDPEHRINVYGALSLGDIDKAKGHAQHGIRSSGSSVSRGLTNGKLGNVFAPDPVEGFSGFAEPIELDGSEGAIFFLPKSYMDNPEQSFGAFITDAEFSAQQVLVGGALQVNRNRGNNPVDFMKAMEGSECTNS